MGPFPARLRAGDGLDYLDVVVGEVTDHTPVWPAWSETAETIGALVNVDVTLPELALGLPNPQPLIISFGARADATGAEIAAMVAGGARYASVMALHLLPVLTADWRMVLRKHGIAEGAPTPDPQRLLSAERSAHWTPWDL